MFDVIFKLPIGESVSIFDDGKTDLYVVRPSKIFKNYDIDKNFQIFIREGNREFRPNHLRVMIDLHLRSISRPDLKRELLLAFDEIFYKKDTFISTQKLVNEEFRFCLNSLQLIAVLHQLFLIEQELNYTKESH